MKRTALQIALFTILLSVAVLAAKHAPLSPALLEAKTVYIQNESGMAELGDRCFEELTKWGRFKVVASPKDADIVFLISSHTATSGYSGNTTGDYNGGTYTNLSENKVGYTNISIIQASTKETLWSDTRRWGMFRSATKGVIKELRRRIEEQEAPPEAKTKHK